MTQSHIRTGELPADGTANAAPQNALMAVAACATRERLARSGDVRVVYIASLVANCFYSTVNSVNLHASYCLVAWGLLQSFGWPLSQADHSPSILSLSGTGDFRKSVLVG